MTSVVIAYGDGIGNEVMDAALMVMREAGAKLEIESIRIGESVYKMGGNDGVMPSAWQSLTRARALLKGPATRPADKQNITETICRHFSLDIDQRLTEQCDAEPGIAAAGYIGEQFALFEPLQDAEEKLAGKNKAHPGAMILAAAMLLDHIGQKDVADAIRRALQTTLAKPKKKIRTQQFAEKIVENLSLTTA